MKLNLRENGYDTMLEASDWRYSAAVYGLVEYLEYHSIDYKREDECIYYNTEDITEERYLKFVEYWYDEEFHHKVIENILLNEEYTDEQIKLVNEKLVANSIMKKVFNKIKFDKNNKSEILDIINSNRNTLIKETYRGKKDMYANYANTNQLLNAGQEYCRLVGYCVDAGKKGKSIGFGFNTNSFVGSDEIEFDFIPFAFTGNRESFFINDNTSTKKLVSTNSSFKRMVKENDDEKKDIRKIFFKNIINTAEFINRDVEVVYKDREKDYFETVYIRKRSIDILKAFNGKGLRYEDFCTSLKVTEKYYINIQKEVVESILNGILLDNLIDRLLKESSRQYLIMQLIKLNILIKGDKTMEDRLKGAYGSAKKVAEKLEINKLESYRQKLTSSIIFKDYDRVCQILLQLSNYSGVEFGFAYDLFEDFESNKELAYTFINALTKKSFKNNENNENNN